MIPMAALVFLFFGGVSGFASHRMNTHLKLSSHHQQEHPSIPSPLSYAIDSTKMGGNVISQNLTLPLLLSDEELLSQIQSPVSTTASAKNILSHAWRKIKGSMKFDREKVAKMGIDFGLTYNMISNINGSVTLSTAWYIASMKSGLSPLAPGNWRSLLAAYASLYVVAALVRPLRIAVALGATHKMERLLQYMQKRIGCTRTNAIGIVFGAGVVVWIALCVGGVTLASALAGVPIWKYHV